MPSDSFAQMLVQSFQAAVAAADPLVIVPPQLGPPPGGRVVVLGAGKAAAAMARAVELTWPNVALEGLVITRYAHGLATERVRVVEAGHPVPDEAGEAAARTMLEHAGRLDPEDLLLVLVSGGGSSLMTLPAPGVSMADLKQLNRALLAGGVPITEMNIVRKHLSAISGGRLAAATRARVIALIVSDVTGDDPSAIASGPCAPDASTFADAQNILKRFRIEAPDAVTAHLSRGVQGEIPETPKPGDALFARVENRIIASAHASLVAAAEWWRAHGIEAAILGDTVTGEAREVARVYAALAREVVAEDAPFRRPVALISGGECTVTIAPENAGHGRGGRCSEFLLALAIELEGTSGIHALACDTDGIDGSEDNAGAFFTPATYALAEQRGLSAQKKLEANDAWGYFSEVDGLVVTGPTRTNVNDYRVILITDAANAMRQMHR